jgi:surface protein
MCISASPDAGETVSIRLFNQVTNVNIDWDDGDITSENVCLTITAKDQDGNNISGTITDGQSYITGISNSPASKDYADTDAVILSCTYNTAGSYTIALGGSFLGYGWSTTPASGVSAITGVTHWGNTGVQSLSGAFRNHNSLIQVPSNLPSTVTTLKWMFLFASKFNDTNVVHWNTSNINNMYQMFTKAANFNQNISTWNTSAATTMNAMFAEAVLFNQDIGNWDVSQVNDMADMFSGAGRFNQDLSQWDISSVNNMNGIFDSAKLSVNNYDALITSWNTQLGDSNLLLGLNFNGGNSKFCEATDPGVSDGDQDCSPRIIRVTLDDPASDTLALTVIFSEPVFSNYNGTGALEADDFNVSITVSDSGTGATLANGTPTSISQNGNSYTLGVTINSGTLQDDQIITVLPAAADSIYDANGNKASHN